MAIQFCCSQCGRPIEVDDEHAGRAAGCPYCRHVVTVPRESTFRPGTAPVAHPLDADTSSGVGDAARSQATTTPRVSAGDEAPARIGRAPLRADRLRTATTYANYSFVCAGISLALFMTAMVAGFVVMLRTSPQTPSRGMDMRRMAEEVQNSPTAVWIQAGQCGTAFFALVGTVLAVVSVSQARAGNWRGWTGLAVCGGTLLCFCGLAVLSAVMLAAGGFPAG